MKDAPDLARRLRSAIAERFPAELSPDRAQALDQMHLGGSAATAELAALVGLAGRERVLDIGSGLGGPARDLAFRHSCVVTRLDASDELLLAAWVLDEVLTAERGTQVRGMASALPFVRASFDVCWLQHVGMNVQAKETLYGEAFRVLRPGGRLAIHEIVSLGAGPGYPTPWAQTAEQSYLADPAEMSALLTRAGFEIEQWVDVTESAREWLVELMPKVRKRPAFSPILTLGPMWPVMMENLLDGLSRGLISVVMAVARRS